jgi:carbonic anhydrase
MNSNENAKHIFLNETIILKTSPDASMIEVQNNQNWVQDKLDIDSNYFKDLSEEQNPDILYIGCSDSRVTAEELMGASPDEAFVHRNIANMKPNTDLSAMSVIN